MSSVSRLRLLADQISDEISVTEGTSSDLSSAIGTRCSTETQRIPGTDADQKPVQLQEESSQAKSLPNQLSCTHSTPVEFSRTPTMSSSGSTTSSADANMFLKLQRQRLKNERIRNSLEQEMSTCELMEKEENALRQKISRTLEVIKNLKEQSDSLESNYIGMEKLYRTNAEKLKIIQKASQDIHEQWRKESGQFNIYSSQLKKLQQQYPDLVNQLAKTADTTTEITNVLIERSIRPPLSNEQRDSSPLGNVEVSIQTTCDMNTFNELESIRKQLSSQRIMMKQVRETVELLRRCP